MKTAKRCALALRIIGWVLIGLAIAMSIYVLANSGSAWKSMKGMLTQTGADTKTFERVSFNHQYFNALNDAALSKGTGDSQRISKVRAYFDTWQNRMEASSQKAADDELEVIYADLEQNFDSQAYLDFYETLESSEEVRHIKEAIEYLDSLSKPSGKGGKLSKLQVASAESDLKAYYEALSAEHGEEAGEYLEFLEAVVALVREDIDGGAKVDDAKAYVNAMDYERYLGALGKIKEQERAANDDIREAFAQSLQAYKDGDSKAIRTYFEGIYASLRERYADDDPIAKNVYAAEMLNLLQDAKYDGSLNSLMKSLRVRQQEKDASGVSVQMNAYARTVVENSDKSSSVSLSRVLWWLAANCLLLWAVGIVLLVLAKVLDRMISKITLARLEKAGIEEEDGVLLRVEHLKQYFRSGDYINKAVDDVSFEIRKGEVFGLVGESGCGKTTTGRTIINLYDPTEGDVYFQGLRISSTQNGLPVLIRSLRNEFQADKRAHEAALKEQAAAHPEQKKELEQAHRQWLGEQKRALSRRISDAKTKALESSVEKSKCVEKYREKRKAELTKQYEEDIRTLSGEQLEVRKARYEMDMKVAAKDNIMTKMQMIFQDPVGSINPRMTVREIIAEGLKIRGIRDEKYIDEKVYEMLDLVGLVREHAARYPHEFSGGQKQRVGIARAIVLEPDLIIADEPISALDVSIQAQVINLLNDLRHKMGLTIMFIAHNLSVVKYFSDRIGVMYYGHLVELTTSEELFAHPLHPYTKSLLSAIPYPDPHHEKYRTRLEYNPTLAHDYSVDKPTLREIRPGHFIRCNDKEFEEYKRELGI